MSLKQRLGFTTEPLYVMDGTAFLYRGFFANANMTRSDGVPTGALYIVGRVLMKLLRDEQPSHFVFMLDGHGPHFRHELFPAYKANRPSAPEGLVAQVEPVKRLVRSLGLHLEVSEACEADDCIAGLVHRFHASRPVIIIGMDKDLRQCLHENVVLWDPASKEEKLVTLQSFQKETGLVPSQWPDVQALVGDSSDNIPGVRGVGAKTAEKLFQDFRSLEDIRDNFGKVPPAIQRKLEGSLDAMFLYRRLTTLDTGCCAHLSLDAMRVRPLPGSDALTLFREFEMNSLHRELSDLVRCGLVQSEVAVGKAETPGGQLSLLDGSAPRQVALPLVSDPKSLPPCKGRVLALTPAPVSTHDRRDTETKTGSADFALALADAGSGQTAAREWRYIGSMDALAAYAAEAELIVTPDVKKLLHEQGGWTVLPPARWFDLGLAAYLLAPEDRDYSWPRLSARHAEKSGLDQNRPASLALSLYHDLGSQMDHAGLTPLYQSMELPLVPVLAAMEKAGIRVDLATLQTFLTEVQNDLDRLTGDIYEAAGGSFNIRSAQQIGEVLFKRLGLPAAKSTKGGQASTSQEVLEKLSGHHSMVDSLLEFRKLEKLRSTYLEPLPRMTGPDGRIHTTFNQTATATGRLSSCNPNLQNIPVRGDLGRRMRTCFTAAPGNYLVSADYSQVELRVLAHYSQDPTLIASFHNKEDIHTRTAALLHDVEPARVTPDQRRAAKTINFGLIYGMGARKLAQELSIPLARAKEFTDTYFARFSRIKEFFDGVEEQAREQGYVTTLAGRRRPLPDMHSQSAQSRALAERQAVNTIIQGSAADIIKLAMLAVHSDAALRALSARLLLQVHDELVLEAPQSGAPAAGQRLAELMTNLPAMGISLSVPLSVDWGAGPHWGSAH